VINQNEARKFLMSWVVMSHGPFSLVLSMQHFHLHLIFTYFVMKRTVCYEVVRINSNFS